MAKRTCGTCAKKCGVAIHPATMPACDDGWHDKRAPLPCPFCGRPAKVDRVCGGNNGVVWRVRHKRGCYWGCNSSEFYEAMDKARIRAWNRRAK